MKKYIYLFAVASTGFLFSCQPEPKESDSNLTEEQRQEEEKKVDDMVKSDKEKADSVKKALGIE